MYYHLSLGKITRAGKRACPSCLDTPHKNPQKIGQDGTDIIEDLSLKFRPVPQKIRTDRRKPVDIPSFKFKNTNIYIKICARKNP